jgi:hypothetical protein
LLGAYHELAEELKGKGNFVTVMFEMAYPGLTALYLFPSTSLLLVDRYLVNVFPQHSGASTNWTN